MSERRLRIGVATIALGAMALSTSAASGPIDAPASGEPRVAVATCLSASGLVSSEGNHQPFFRVGKGDTIHSRDVLVNIPGLKSELRPTSKAVTLTLWGNVPWLSETPVQECSVVLHDSSAYDLDLTLVQGRIVLTNTKKKGSARVWLRGMDRGVQLILPSPGDSVAVEIYGRWPAGVPFSMKRQRGHGPLRVWEVNCLKGNLEIKAGPTEWFMAEPPGPAYFHGDSVEGPEDGGPQKRSKLPAWADPKAPRPPLAKKIDAVMEAYRGRLKSKDAEQVGREILVLAEKEKDPDIARVMRGLVVFGLAAIDDVDKVAEILGDSKHPEMRHSAVVALRHWIGAREGRDEKLYDVLHHELEYTKAEAETILQLLHSPFDPKQPETYETLIAYLRHRKQAIRALSHWHLVRLAPIGRRIPYDASAPASERDKAAAEWKKRVPPGELPKNVGDIDKKDG